MNKPNQKSLLPCSSCPWRVSTDASIIPGYDHQKAIGLMATAVGEGDAFRPMMACHHSTDRHMRACKGYLAREGWSNLNVRVLLARDEMPDPTAVLAACETHDVALHPDYPAVLKKLTDSHGNQKKKSAVIQPPGKVKRKHA